MNSLSRLHKDKEQLSEVADFIDFILAKETEENLQKGIEKLSEQSGSLHFLNEEGELYSVSDVKKEKTNVEILREIRDKISLDIQDMNFEELKEYFARRQTLHPKSA
jgi:hypothetical protein